MIPQAGQHVKCVLRTGAIAEGIVENWYQNEVQLISLDGESLLIITHPEEDIMLIKILIKSKSEILKVPVTKTELQQEFQTVYEQPSNDDLRVKKMADLKIMMAEQEKKIITEKMKDHHVGEVKKVAYGYPGPDKK